MFAQLKIAQGTIWQKQWLRGWCPCFPEAKADSVCVLLCACARIHMYMLHGINKFLPHCYLFISLESSWSSFHLHLGEVQYISHTFLFRYINLSASGWAICPAVFTLLHLIFICTSNSFLRSYFLCYFSGTGTKLYCSQFILLDPHRFSWSSLLFSYNRFCSWRNSCQHSTMKTPQAEESM